MQVRPVMVTGDNAQCGHYIAKASGMIAEEVPVLLGDVTSGGTVSFSPMESEQGKALTLAQVWPAIAVADICIFRCPSMLQ